MANGTKKPRTSTNALKSKSLLGATRAKDDTEVNGTRLNSPGPAPRLATFERKLFEFARPQHVVLTTPNAEYNEVFGSLSSGEFRHGDHRFEWIRAQFEQWAGAVASRFGYTVRVEPVGPEVRERGAPTQMAVFTRKEVAA